MPGASDTPEGSAGLTSEGEIAMEDGVGARRQELHALDYVFLLRPSSLVPLWIFQLAGAAAAGRAIGADVGWPGLPDGAGLGLLVTSLTLGGGYVLNQIRDIESDRRNRKLFLLPDGLVSMPAAWAEMAAVWAVALLLSLLLPTAFRWIVVVSLFMNVTYSTPPINAKSRAPLDLVWNGVFFGLVAYAAGWASAAPLDLGRMGAALAYAPAVAGVIASTTILDIPGDVAQRAATTGAILGVRRTSALAVGLLAVGAGAGWLVRDSMGLLGPLVSLPLFLRAHASGRRPHRIAANQVAVAAFSILVGIRAPLMLALLAVVYFGTRAYYWARFGLRFPGKGTP